MALSRRFALTTTAKLTDLNYNKALVHIRAEPSSSCSSSSVPQTSHWVLWIQFQVQIFSCISLPALVLIHPPVRKPAKSFLMEVVWNQFSMISIFINPPPLVSPREIRKHSPTSQRPRPVKFTVWLYTIDIHSQPDAVIDVVMSDFSMDHCIKVDIKKWQTILNKEFMLNQEHSQMRSKTGNEGKKKHTSHVTCGLVGSYCTCEVLKAKLTETEVAISAVVEENSQSVAVFIQPGAADDAKILQGQIFKLI